MGLVLGNASTFGANAFVLNGGRVIFVPSSPAVTGDTYLLSDRRVEVALVDGTGHFEVDLIATSLTRPGTYYTVILDSPGPTGKRRHRAVLPGEFRVPAGAGPFNFAELLTASANPAMAWVGPEYPSNAPPSHGTWWLDTNPDSPYYGWLKEWI